MKLTPRERLTRALSCQPVDRAPVWFMRQAGRYLPEYREIREEASFLEVCQTPELAREVTLQPLERFGLDAAIVFSDILVPLEGMGHPVTYEPGVGPVVEDPVRTPEDVDALDHPAPREAYPWLAEAIRAVREAIPHRGLVGFAGAPYTLAVYLIEGRSPKRYQHVDRFRLEHPDAFERLLDLLANIVGDQLTAQADAGADAVQLFDTHAEQLALADYRERALGPTQRALDAVDSTTADRIHFARGTAHLMPALAELDVEALSVDWRIDLATVHRHAPSVAVQGNLDPATLHGPPEHVREATRRVLDQGAPLPGHVFNLGHGIRPEARIDAVQAMVGTVHEHATSQGSDIPGGRAA